MFSDTKSATNLVGVRMMGSLSSSSSSLPDPPFETAYKNLLENYVPNTLEQKNLVVHVEEFELPLIDMKDLRLGEVEREACKKQIWKASKEWGFFQIINHRVSREVMEKMREEQVKLMKKPFQEKELAYKHLNLSVGSYLWGTPSPSSVKQLSWSEAFHVQLNDILGAHNTTHLSLRSSMEQFALTICEVAQELAEILTEGTGVETAVKCVPSSCYLRLNRYPPCPTYSHMMGLIPHTDTSFLTVLHQDNVGGLQLRHNGKWLAVKPNPLALIINIGDLFQALSTNMYKSVEHRVVANPVTERFSTAYFFCPPPDTVIESRGVGGAVYRSFSFAEYKEQTRVDVQRTGHKVGLPRFLLPIDQTLS